MRGMRQEMEEAFKEEKRGRRRRMESGRSAGSRRGETTKWRNERHQCCCPLHRHSGSLRPPGAAPRGRSRGEKMWYMRCKPQRGRSPPGFPPSRGSRCLKEDERDPRGAWAANRIGTSTQDLQSHLVVPLLLDTRAIALVLVGNIK